MKYSAFLIVICSIISFSCSNIQNDKEATSSLTVTHQDSASSRRCAKIVRSDNAKKNDWDEDNLKGRIKSLHEFSYKAIDKFGEIQKSDKIGESSSKYDEKGNLIEKNWYKSDGGRIEKWTFKYDVKGNKIEENLYNSDGSLDIKWIYKYDEKKNKIECNTYYSDGSLQDKETFKYDEKGKQIEDNHYKSDGSRIGKWISKYNERGRQIEDNHYKSDGSLGDKWTSKYKFDIQENYIEKIEFKNDIPQTITERQIGYY